MSNETQTAEITSETEISDAQNAVTVDGAEETQTPRETSTIERLFPDFIGEEGEVLSIPRDLDTSIQAPKEELKAPITESKPSEPETKPKGPEYLDLSQIEGKLAKVKVDGVEMDVPAVELIKSYQLERYLTQKSQKLAEQERELKEILKNLNPEDKPKRERRNESSESLEETSSSSHKDPKVIELERSLAEIRSVLADVLPVTQDMRYKKGLESIDREIRESLGFDDFLTYAPKIKEFATSQLRDPKNPTEEELARFDTKEFYKAKYQEFKLKELQSKAKQPPVPAQQTKQVENKRPILVDVEGSNSVPSGPRLQDQGNIRLKAAYKKAAASGDSHDWAEYIRLKHEQSS